MSTITLEEALGLFEFPRELGNYEDKAVSVGIGRFGPYVRHDNKYVSIPSDMAATEVTLEQAIELIEAKRSADRQKTITVFEEDPDVQVLNGRYGPYIAYKKKNYKLPKDIGDPAAITLEQARKIIADADAAPAPARRTSSKKKK